MGRNLALIALLIVACALFAQQQRQPPGAAPVFEALPGGGGWSAAFQDGGVRVFASKDPDTTCWSRPGQGSLQWSPDGSRLAFYQTGPRFALTVWSPSSVRDYKGPFLDSEGPLQMAFSANDQHLLLRVAQTFGAFDVDLGQVYSLNLQTGQSRKWENSARRVQWRDNRAFTFWTCPPNQDRDADHWTTIAHQAHF